MKRLYIAAALLVTQHAVGMAPIPVDLYVSGTVAVDHSVDVHTTPLVTAGIGAFTAGYGVYLATNSCRRRAKKQKVKQATPALQLEQINHDERIAPEPDLEKGHAARPLEEALQPEIKLLSERNKTCCTPAPRDCFCDCARDFALGVTLAITGLLITAIKTMPFIGR